LIPRPGEVAGVAQLAAKSGNELFECLDLARMLIEPRGVLNTGHAGGERTAENDVWI
jgi:hypothetical protein